MKILSQPPSQLHLLSPPQQHPPQQQPQHHHHFLPKQHLPRKLPFVHLLDDDCLDYTLEQILLQHPGWEEYERAVRTEKVWYCELTSLNFQRSSSSSSVDKVELSSPSSSALPSPVAPPPTVVSPPIVAPVSTGSPTDLPISSPSDSTVPPTSSSVEGSSIGPDLPIVHVEDGR
nr:uncharacterized protein LOC109149905 [Ipomoea batatas]